MHAAAALQRNAQHAFVRPAHPEEDRIDRVAAWYRAHIAQRPVHFPPGLRFDDVEHARGDLFGFVEARPFGGSEADLELASVYAGKDFEAEARTNQPDNQPG